MNVGDNVYCIRRKEFGRIDKVQCDPSGLDDFIYFVSFADGIGFWFWRSELTEG